MKPQLLLPLSAAALLCPAAPALAQTIVPTSASHEVTSHAFVYDTVWRDTVVDDDAKSSASFDFDATAETHIGATYQSAYGSGLQVCQVGGDSIYAETWSQSNAVDYDGGQATASNATGLGLSFNLTARARASFYFELGASAAANASEVSTSLAFVGPGGTIFERSFDESGGDNGPTYQYLQPGSYSIAGDTASSLTARHFAGSHDPAEQANAYFIAWLQVFCPADFQADGDVDATDYNAFDDLWGQGSLEADVNGDGEVDGADYDAYEAAYFGGC